MKKIKFNWIFLPWILMFPDISLTYEQSLAQDVLTSKARVEVEFFRGHIKVLEEIQ